MDADVLKNLRDQDIKKVSVVIPAKNEADSLAVLLPKLMSLGDYFEIILVNDGSTDHTSQVCEENAVIEVVHQYSMGNGAAIKSGTRTATGEIIVFMDADGQHKVEDISLLLTKISEGFDLVVGARERNTHANWMRLCANEIYNHLASWMVEQKIPDLTSGFRAVRAHKFRQFLYLLPNGFSYPTTSTMAFYRAGFPVAFVPIQAKKRLGRSHISPLKDGVRFLLIIFKVCCFYSPLRVFFPVSAIFLCGGLGYYLYTYLSFGRFTNMGALLLLSAATIFLIGLVSEQITTLMYKGHENLD